MRRHRKYILPSFFFFLLITLLVFWRARSTGEYANENEVEHKNDDHQQRLKRNIKFKETWLKRNKTAKSIISATNLPGIYLREAYRVADDEIRLVYLENQDNRRGLQAMIHTNWEPMSSFCFNSTCMDYLFCSIATRIATVTVPPKTPHLSTLAVKADGADEFFTIPLSDVRVKSSKYEHQLGVCLQPIFFFTDWTIISQFFESWIAQGATKFYFYLHSYNKQTKQVLDFYKQSLGDGLELIEWSDLPVHSRDRGDYYKDPNARVFRYGATAFMHDCLLRSRSHVKFVSNTDLDDLPVSENLHVVQQLEDASRRHPQAGQFVVDWILSHQKQSWDSISTMLDVRFDLQAVRVLELESIRYDYRVSKKMFHRPERVIHFDMHSVYRNELIPGTEEQYTTLQMFGSSKLFFLHLRRFERHLVSPPDVDYDDSFDYNLLMRLNSKMSMSYVQRLKNSTLSEVDMTPWALEARETIRNLEQCRLEGFGTRLDDKNQMCQQSSAGCAGMLTTGIDFIRTSLTWIDVAHSANFNNYTDK